MSKQTGTKKKLYCAFVLVDENVEVKEHGAAIRYIDTDGKDQTKQAPMFLLEGDSKQILDQMTTRLLNGFVLLDAVLAPAERKSNLIVPGQ